MKFLIEHALTRNDEITSRGLKDLLLAQWPDLQVSFPTIKRVRKEMGWVCTRPHYCQLLCPVSSIVLLMSKYLIRAVRVFLLVLLLSRKWQTIIITCHTHTIAYVTTSFTYVLVLYS